MQTPRFLGRFEQFLVSLRAHPGGRIVGAARQIAAGGWNHDVALPVWRALDCPSETAPCAEDQWCSRRRRYEEETVRLSRYPANRNAQQRTSWPFSGLRLY